MRAPRRLALLLMAVPALLHAAPTPVKPVPPDPKQFSKAVEQLATGARPMESFRLDVSWAGNATRFSAEVHGSGVGILNRKTQFTLSKAKLGSMVRLLHQSRFGDLKARYGGFNRPGIRGPAQGGPARGGPVRGGPVRGGPVRGGPVRGAPEFLQGSVEVTIEGVKKSVTQLGGGEQSETLAKLANELLSICSKAANKDGVTATDMKDGLAKIRDGKLHPVALSVLVHRLIQKKDVKGERFLLRLEGNTVTSRTNTPSKGYGPEMRFSLSDKELAKISKLMIDNEVGDLPINLWALHYTDLRVKVLDKERSTQARQFARLTPKTHGERQKHFDRIFEAMVELHRRAMKEGKEVPRVNQ